MKDLNFRTLMANEIEVRPATIQNGKATMLLYIDSRAVTKLLDETLGKTNWTLNLKDVCGQMVGSLGVWDEDKNAFVYKEDTGSESNIEAEKGLVSDIYKRCLARWGVTELYSAPRIIMEDDGYKMSGYKVSEIEYNDKREITHLVIVNKFGKEAFRWDIDAPTNQTYHTQPINHSTGLKSGNNEVLDNATILKNFCNGIWKTLNAEEQEKMRKFNAYWSKRITEGTFRGVIKPESLWRSELNRVVA